MAQYMVIFGPMGVPKEKVSPVAVKTDGRRLTITGNKDAVDYWSDVLQSSLVLASYVDGNQVALQSYASGFTNLDVLWFDDSTYDSHEALFEGIKGASKTIELERVPSVDDDDFSIEKVRAFVKKTQSIQDRLASRKE